MRGGRSAKFIMHYRVITSMAEPITIYRGSNELRDDPPGPAKEFSDFFMAGLWLDRSEEGKKLQEAMAYLRGKTLNYLKGDATRGDFNAARREFASQFKSIDGIYGVIYHDVDELLSEAHKGGEKLLKKYAKCVFKAGEKITLDDVLDYHFMDSFSLYAIKSRVNGKIRAEGFSKTRQFPASNYSFVHATAVDADQIITDLSKIEARDGELFYGDFPVASCHVDFSVWPLYAKLWVSFEQEVAEIRPAGRQNYKFPSFSVA